MGAHNRFDVIVVGAGPAGSSAALRLARRGARVLVLERAEVPGQKSMFGGMLPWCPLFEELIPDFFARAPFERNVVKRVLTILGEGNSTSLSFADDAFDCPPYNGVTVFRPLFDRWYAEQAQKAGAVLLCGVRVDGLVREGAGEKSPVVGVRLEGARGEVRAPVVILCDGVLSLLAQSAGLRADFRPGDMAVGVRALLRLSEEEINRRFGLARRQGASLEFLGATAGVRGGGFIYTQAETLSVGVVLHLDSLKDSGTSPQLLLERFLELGPVAEFTRGGRLLEYSAHLLPEGGLAMVPRLYADGVMLAGDAAALCYTNGLIQEGMNLAAASGVAAADTALEALGANDVSAARLRAYERRLKESFVLADMKTFAGSAKMMHNSRLFTVYPRVVGAVLSEMYRSGETPKRKLGRLVRAGLGGEVAAAELLKDLVQAGGSLAW